MKIMHVILLLLLVTSLLAPIKPLHAQEGYTGASNVQLLYGQNVREPNSTLTTITFEHFGKYKAFEHFGFADFFHIPETNTFEIYSEWYPKISLSRLTKKEMNVGPLTDILIGTGYNALVRNLEDFFVVVGGLVWLFDVPGFSLSQLETYFYQHLGYPVSYQITYAWDVPIPITEKFILRTRGFIDYIGPYGSYQRQIITQPQLLLDLGVLWGSKGKLFAGTEWRYWNNFQGEQGKIESIPQFDILFQF
jgi:nucleoside-specific outer membrane channel protein Tsx